MDDLYGMEVWRPTWAKSLAGAVGRSASKADTPENLFTDTTGRSRTVFISHLSTREHFFLAWWPLLGRHHTNTYRLIPGTGSTPPQPVDGLL